MRTSQFWQLIADEFGDAYGRVLVEDLVLGECGDVTGRVALDRGDDPRVVWLALCRATEVPKSRWHGIERKHRRRG
ncbi:DUF3046 domain-containing protein [Pseudoclavibacter caeni]|jgi:hypothetical protein|uniref:DUF3046 domain-containing protein n=1 Tax=Pseudoclavibacter caeni TaxID=908846 RepID=A0A7C8FTW8_9MICO|nr:DUF3046 domain-containing protein [Pseudoclavibacter caeni]KAB1632390.1 DUF3046 domain-containing protein [Pseudoclavibacter caeni]NYJ97635.1 hypothetical protein [Pseudoclavibacter caeni]